MKQFSFRSLYWIFIWKVFVFSILIFAIYFSLEIQLQPHENINNLINVKCLWWCGSWLVFFEILGIAAETSKVTQTFKWKCILRPRNLSYCWHKRSSSFYIWNTTTCDKMQLSKYCTTFKNSIEIFRIKLKMANGNEKNTQHSFKRHCFIEVLIHFLCVCLRAEKKTLLTVHFMKVQIGIRLMSPSAPMCICIRVIWNLNESTMILLNVWNHKF